MSTRGTLANREQPSAIAPRPRLAVEPLIGLRAAAPAARRVGGIVVLAGAYYAAGRLSLALQFVGPVAAVWLPVGVGAAALYLAGLRWWPGVVIGDVALADPAQPLVSALGITAGNVADILVIALLLRHLLGPRCGLDRRDHVAALLAAIVTGAAVTATVAVICLRTGGVVPAAETVTFWRSWFLADASGSLVVIPLALAWAQPRPERWHAREALEGTLVLATVVCLSAIAFSTASPLMYTVFPALIWAALRFGQRGATLAVAIAAGMAVALTVRDIGPFVQHSVTDTALSTQLYVAVAAITTLFLAAIVSERRRATEQLADARDRIVAADAERRRIERDLHDGAQQRLIALRIRLGLAGELMHDDAPAAGRSVEELGELVDAALTDLRAIAAGVFPPTLATSGLAPALRDLARGAAIPTRVDVDGIQRCRPEVETAVYFCCSEAIQNAAKHARADTTVSVRLTRPRSGLRFEIHDDGPGFVVPEVRAGGGLANMRDRIDAVGGTLAVRSSPGNGARVIGDIPQP